MTLLRKILRGVIPSKYYELLPSSYDIVGEAILISIPEELREYYGVIGSKLLEIHRNVRAVYRISGVTCGTYRVRPLELIAGEDLQYTIHKEYGVKIFIDLKNVYVNPSLSYEHHRVSELVQDGEKVLDMFTGAGGFTLHIASKRKVYVVAIDINPYAVKCVVKGIKLNKLRGVVDVINADSMRSSNLLRRKFTRIIMNLPERSYDFLKEACELLEEYGVIHYYRFSDLLDKVVHEIIKGVACQGRRVVKILCTRRVFKVSPSRSLFVVDACIL